MKIRSWDWLALVLWPLLAAMLGWQAAPLGGVKLACAAGAGLGILLHWRLRSLPLRLPALWGLTLAAWGIIGLIQKLLLQTEAPSRILGPERTFFLAENFTALTGWTVLLLALRWSSARLPAFIALEGILAASSIVWIFSAHRDGFINRPFFLVDRLWGQGYDPLPVFLFLGIICALLVGSLAASHHRGRRSLWDLVILVVLLGLAFMLVPPNKVKEWTEKYGMSDGKSKDKDKRYSPQGKKKGKGSGSPTPSSGSPSPSDGKPSGSPTPNEGEQQNQEPSFADQQPEPKNPPVAVVIFRDDYNPESKAFYFRQDAFSEYNGIKLVQSSNHKYDQDNPTGYPTYTQSERVAGDPLGMKLPDYDRSAFDVIPTRVALMSQMSRPFGLSNPVRFWSCDNPDPSRFQKAYDVESMALTLPYLKMLGRKAGDPDWDADTWAHYLEGPKDKRYKELVDKILADIKPEYKRDEFHKAIAIKLWLDDNCTYSLHSRYENSSDPVGDFLFGDRVGYCVFTAHSACYLFRAAGIPARIAGGFATPAAGKGNSASLLIRSKDAHSWPEIYLQGLGWFALDINPKKNLEPPSDPVDNGLQNMLGDMARKDKDHKAPNQPQQTLDIQKLIKELLKQMAVSLPLSLLLTALFLLSVKLYRRFSPYLLERWWNPTQLAVRTYMSVLDSLNDHGYARRMGETREEFARKVEPVTPSLTRLTRLHLAARLGQQQVSPQELKEAFGAVRQELKHKPRGWRYWLRLLNPVSWWSVN